MLVVSFAVQGQPKWRAYVSPDKSFIIDLPWNPIYRRLNVMGMVPGSAGPFKGITSADVYNLNMFTDEPYTHFIISVYGVANARAEREFDTECDSILFKEGRQFLKKDSVLVNSLHGREYIYQKDKASAVVLMVYTDHRIYFVEFYTEDKKGVQRGAVAKVFNSFRPTP